MILLTARADEADKITGLGLGADDYVVKPFSFHEVAARIEAVLRRTGRPAAVLRGGDVVLDAGARRATVRGRPVELTPAEFAVPTRSWRRPAARSRASTCSSARPRRRRLGADGGLARAQPPHQSRG